MAFKKATIVKPWTHPSGVVFKVGQVFRCTPALWAELVEGGYIAGPQKPKPKKDGGPKRTTKNTEKI